MRLGRLSFVLGSMPLWKRDLITIIRKAGSREESLQGEKGMKATSKTKSRMPTLLLWQSERFE